MLSLAHNNRSAAVLLTPFAPPTTPLLTGAGGMAEEKPTGQKAPLSRAEALALGLSRYFTGAACKRGHLAERYTCSRTCLQCQGVDSQTPNEKRALQLFTLCLRCRRKQSADRFRVRKATNGKRYSHPYCDKCSSEMAAEWRRRHPEKYSALLRAQQMRVGFNPNAKAASQRAHNSWRRRHPSKVFVQAARARARKKGAIGTHTGAEWDARLLEFNGRCAYCLNPFDKLTQDHLLPLARGGSNDIGNIVPACTSCNSKKNSRTLLELLAGWSPGGRKRC
jgi:5-methylcytosine-specific restriction endonuclease McrA